MIIRFCDDGDETIHKVENGDTTGMIAIQKEDPQIVFQERFYKYSNMTLNHYKEDGSDDYVQELIVYLEP